MDSVPAGPPWVINGKRYSLWPKFVLQKKQWIGGTLKDYSANADTKITDIRFEPNGTDSAMFTICGEEFECSADIHYLAIDPQLGARLGEGWIGFSSSFGLQFAIKEKDPA